MPVVGPEYGTPSHLGVVMLGITQAVAQSGSGIPVLVGEHYASDKCRGAGSAPFILLVPEPRGGRARVEDASEMGRPAKQVHQCDVVVRAAETGDDISRWDPAYELLDFAVSIIADVGVGRVKWQSPIGDYPTPTTVDMLGAQLSIGFSFERDVRKIERIAARAGADADATPVRPLIPPGETGTLDTITGDVDAAEDA